MRRQPVSREQPQQQPRSWHMMMEPQCCPAQTETESKIVPAIQNTDQFSNVTCTFYKLFCFLLSLTYL